MNINTHGRKIDLEQLKKAAKMSGYPANTRYISLIRYMPLTGDIWTTYIDENATIEAEDEIQIRCQAHMSEQVIMDTLHGMMEEMERVNGWGGYKPFWL